MASSSLRISAHANKRLGQRNLSVADVEMVIRHGASMYRAGVMIYFLGRRQLQPLNDRSSDHLEGTTVLRCSTCGFVITAYRNRRNGWKYNRRKTKYNYRKDQCPACGIPHIHRQYAA